MLHERECVDAVHPLIGARFERVAKALLYRSVYTGFCRDDLHIHIVWSADQWFSAQHYFKTAILHGLEPRHLFSLPRREDDGRSRIITSVQFNCLKREIV